jgi:predicted signal transduction protein with EAL and GGDEF domain
VGEVAVGVCAGAATWRDGDDLEALVRRAEQALAAAQAGRRGAAGS